MMALGHGSAGGWVHKARLVVVLLAVPLMSCAPGKDLPAIGHYDPVSYRLGPNDQIHVVTYGETQLSLDYRINDAGNVAMPLLGDVAAEGLTTKELGTRVTQLLEDRGLLKGASVSVQIVSYRSVSVLGEVVKPGQYPYQPGMTMLSLVAAAGGFTYRAVEDYGYVLRQEQGKQTAQAGRIDPQDYVKPGDMLKVYERIF